MLKRWLVMMMVLLLASCSSGGGGDDNDDDNDDGNGDARLNAEILWDVWGVPHIFAENNESLFYAFGYASAQNHGDLILKLYGESRGRAAEYWGEDFLAGDQLMRTLGVPQEGIDGYTKLDAEWKSYVDAYALGINDYATEHPNLITDKYEAVLPVMPQDVIAHGARNMRYVFVAGNGISTALEQQITPTPSGSNAWAIGPTRSASGNAMLVANPHQPWNDLGLWIEAHFVTPDVNLYGAALVGAPVLTIAFNDHLGWTHTVNTHDGYDLYELALTEDGTGYVLDGEERPFDVREEVILVRQDDGTMQEVPLSVKSSVHGPVLAQNSESTALALRVVGEDSFEAAIEWWEMGHATNLEEFEAALRDIRIPMFTVIYADKDGNILHVFNEQVPIRETGDWEFWNDTDAIDTVPSIIPGDDSQYLWERNYHPYEDLPRVLNPETGWLQNANEPPYTTTIPAPFEPGDFPAYMVPEPYIWPRPLTSMRLLYEDESITYKELLDYKQSTFVELTTPILDDLIAAARASGSSIARRAANVLAAWDRTTEAKSRGAVLFIAWASTYIEPIGFDAFETEWDYTDPLNSLEGLADPDAAVAALIQAGQALDAFKWLGLGMDVAYGDVFRLRYRDSGLDLPANGTQDLLGSFRILTFVQDSDLRFRPVHGDSFIAVVEFGDTVQAQVLLTYGNSTQPGNPHVGDQLRLLANKLYRPALLTRDAIQTQLNYAETVGSSQ